MNTSHNPFCICTKCIALPASFKDGDVILLSVPGLEVNTALQPVLFEGLQDHTFGIDLCGGEGEFKKFNHEDDVITYSLGPQPT